jgi:glycosyltransferase involved in cell wall biosynthesis
MNDSKMYPKISIILCTYNRFQSLVKCIQSVLNQSFTDFEFIIVNDFSTDETFEYLKSISKEDSRLQILHNSENFGLQKSLNIALGQSKGKLIARIDDDDVWTVIDKLSLQINEFDQNPNLVLLGTGYAVGDVVKHNPRHDKDIRKQILFRCPFQHSTVMFKRQINGQKVKYNDELAYGEDWALWLHLGQHGELANLPVNTTFINDKDNLSSQHFVSQHKVNKQIVKPFYSFYPGKWRAKCYHYIVTLFFSIFPLNGPIHKLAQTIFNRTYMK